MNSGRKASILEKCCFCGQRIAIDDDDVVQLHAGVVGGLVHADCLAENEGDASGPGEAA
jgi:hypothetical protein